MSKISRFIPALLTLTLLAGSIIAYAGNPNWVKVAIRPQYAIFVDLGNVAMNKGSGGKTQPHVWVSKKYLRPRSGTKISYQNEWWEVTCGQQRILIHEAITYDANDRLVQKVPRKMELFVRPRTDQIAVYDAVCAYIKKPDKKLGKK